MKFKVGDHLKLGLHSKKYEAVIIRCHPYSNQYEVKYLGGQVLMHSKYFIEDNYLPFLEPNDIMKEIV